MAILGLNNFNLANPSPFEEVRLPCPYKTFGVNVKHVISLDILSDRHILRKYEMMTYLDIKWDLDLAMINTHLYYTKNSVKSELIEVPKL
jgi:hypothetical protein